MRVEIFIKPGYTFRVYDDVESVEAAKQDFLDELKDNIGPDHLEVSIDDDDEQAAQAGKGAK
ncbi:MAG: hypothetical protein BWY57_03481 [Betaproteobacteria bacterium ADurb.Bin341]|nr:MAG: hypothetical protein BWY57_03481 [Betaproteobacteria bacterium ADurb.Bin341]